MAWRAFLPARAARTSLLGLALAGLLTAACGRAVVPLAGLEPALGVYTAVARGPERMAAVGAPDSVEALEGALFARVNVDRAAHGLRPVVPDASLLETARARAAAQ